MSCLRRFDRVTGGCQGWRSAPAAGIGSPGDRQVMNWRWVADWIWGLPLLILTVVVDVFVFVMMVRTLRKAHAGKTNHRRRHFIANIAVIALGAAALHSFEASLWATLYIWVGALPDEVTAMLYSLSAITSYGHAGV